MARLPKITVQGWTADGPAYTIHHPVSGFRNRKLRRSGQGGEEYVGDHHSSHEDVEGPAAYMVYARGDVEVYAFKGGYVYQVTLLVDGDPIDVLVDARPGDRIETIADDIQLLEQRALEGDELDRALLNGPTQQEYASDGAESQEPHPTSEGDAGEQEPQITALTGAQVEAPPASAVPVAEELTDAQVDELDTQMDEAEDAARDAKHAAAEAAAGDSADDDDDSSTGPHNYDGTVAEFEELVEAMEDDELMAYREQDTRKGVRHAAEHELMRRQDEASLTGDDTAGGNGEPASSEEE